MKNLAAILLSEHMKDLPEEKKRKIIKRFSSEVMEQFETLVTALRSGIEIYAEQTNRATGNRYILSLKMEVPEPVEEKATTIQTKNKA